jgi:hypothetical protein
MTNDRGLFIDGLHISGYLDKDNNNTKCDTRDEMVFTYNQGVLLTGQRGLWDATGISSFLTDGHDLIQNVINATGYDLTSDSPFGYPLTIEAGVLPQWYGLGRLGVMEEYCDASGTCSQDGQTFKGIFFHHLAAFCAPLEAPTPKSGLQLNGRAFAAIKQAHAEACKSYSGWLEHNVHAAMGTQDRARRFGQWWTAGLLSSNWIGPWPTLADDGIDDKPNATDYRNYGVPPSETKWHSTPRTEPTPYPIPLWDDSKQGQLPLRAGQTKQRQAVIEDPNNRGRGRTVETQSGGLALLRAYWKIARPP